MTRSFCRSLVLAGLLAAAFAACSLNPQPIPPGYANDEASPTGSGAVDASTKTSGPNAADGGVDVPALDAGANNDASQPAPHSDGGLADGDVRESDAGDAGDANDAASDDAGDAGDALAD